MKKSFLVITVFLISGLIGGGILFCFAQDTEKTAGPSAQGAPTPLSEAPAGGPVPSTGTTPGQAAVPGPIGTAPPAAMPTATSPAPTPSPVAQVGLQPASSSYPAPSREEAEEGVKINQERISLDLKGIDIIELFRILSLKTGLTIVPTKTVAGRVNIFLNNLTFADALDIILISQDLACERKGNIINVMTASEYERLYGKKYNEKRKFATYKLQYAKPSLVFNALGQVRSDIGKLIVDESSGTILMIDIPEKLELMERTIRELDQPLDTEVFDLKYAKSSDIKAHLSTAITAGAGEVFVDDKSSKVVVTDLPEKMKKIRRMVKAFDAAPQQVLIEAEIIQLSLRKEYAGGIDWQRIISEGQSKNLWLKWLLGIPSVNLQGHFPPTPALAASYQRVTIGNLQQDKFTMVLNMLATYGDAKTLSRPRIAALNNQEAKIMVGSREAYVTQTLSQAQTTTVTSENIQFIDVGVKLNVVPTINSEGFVTMKIKPEVSRVREVLTTSLGSTIPIVETSEAETVIKVKDGTMIMIGGLMKEERNSDTSGLPGLAKVKVLGNLFGTKSNRTRTTEIIVFITPHIISGDVSVTPEDLETTIPPEVLPKDMEKNIIGRKIDDIKLKTSETLSEKDMMKAKEMPVAAGKADLDIQSKIKGLKKY